MPVDLASARAAIARSIAGGSPAGAPDLAAVAASFIASASLLDGGLILAAAPSIRAIPAPDLLLLVDGLPLPAGSPAVAQRLRFVEELLLSCIKSVDDPVALALASLLTADLVLGSPAPGPLWAQWARSMAGSQASPQRFPSWPAFVGDAAYGLGESVPAVAVALDSDLPVEAKVLAARGWADRIGGDNA